MSRVNYSVHKQSLVSTQTVNYLTHAPCRSRTYNLLIRSQTLYPIALMVQITANLPCLHNVDQLAVCFLNKHAGARDRTGTVSLPQDFKSCASAYSATPAAATISGKANGGTRTRDPHHGKVMFYH